MFSERIWNNNNHSKRYPFGMPTTENRAKLKDPRIYHPINQVDESSKMQRVNVFQQRLNKGMKPNIPKQYEELLITPPTPLTSPIKNKALTLKQKKMQHYVAPTFLNRRAYHRSQPLKIAREKDQWITTNAAMLKPNKPQLGVERCSWVGPESEDGHFHSYHQSLLKNMDKVNTEYKQQFIINYSDSEESGESDDEEDEDHNLKDKNSSLNYSN